MRPISFACLALLALAAKGVVAAATPIQGWGERKPVAPNTKPDGSDDPQGRQKNRRVEVILDLCKEPS
jgi:outer membrane protein OmpA-like peptidoglycan-associated protein